MSGRNKGQLQVLFPDAYILYENVDLDHDKVLKELSKLDYKELGDQPVYMTTSVKIFKKSKLLNEVKHSLETLATHAVSQMLGYDRTLRLINLWATKTPPKSGSGTHNHRNFWYSCVYYPHGSQADEFAIKFSTNKHQDRLSVPVRSYNPFNSSDWTQLVKKGDVLIFPGNIFHQILSNKTSDFRFSVAATFLPAGEIGINDGTINFDKIGG